MASGFWDDQKVAQQKMQELSTVREIVETWNGLHHRAEDALELLEMADDESGHAQRVRS